MGEYEVVKRMGEPVVGGAVEKPGDVSGARATC